MYILDNSDNNFNILTENKIKNKQVLSKLTIETQYFDCFFSSVLLLIN